MKKATTNQRIVAKLDDNGVLIGSDVVAIGADGIDFGDLPTNGTYKYDGKAGHFIPLGHGFGKVKTREPYEPSYIMATMIETLEKAGIELPEPLVAWREWYDTELRRRHEEKAAQPR